MRTTELLGNRSLQHRGEGDKVSKCEFCRYDKGLILHRYPCGLDECRFEETDATNNQTAKADAGKARLTLAPLQILYDIARVREYGCNKYPDGGVDNWKQVEVERYRDAAFRHFIAYIQNPESIDEESGLPHRWHLECNLAFLAELEGE